MRSYNHGLLSMKLALIEAALHATPGMPELFREPIIGEKRAPAPRTDLDRIALDRAEAKRARKAARK